MKATDLRAKSVDALNAELIKLRRAQFSLRMQVATLFALKSMAFIFASSS